MDRHCMLLVDNTKIPQRGYDPSTNSWEVIQMPVERYRGAAVYVPVTHSIFYLGGLKAGGVKMNDIYVYNITTGEWIRSDITLGRRRVAFVTGQFTP